MSDSATQPDFEGHYPVDFENAAEMARLAKQARLMIEVAGLLPEPLDFSPGARLLDVGCGPGEWVLKVARLFPASEVIGIDISNRMLDYTRARAQGEHLENVQCLLHDAHQPFPFTDASFDFINLSAATSYLGPAGWPKVLEECFRLLRPGGMFCNVEAEGPGVVTTPALGRSTLLMCQALRQVGQIFATEGPLFGITAVQRKLLRQAGFTEIQSKSWAEDYSAGTPANPLLQENFQIALKLIQPLLIACGLETQEKLDLLYQQALHEMTQDDFCAIGFGQVVWGKKPVQERA